MFYDAARLVIRARIGLRCKTCLFAPTCTGPAMRNPMKQLRSFTLLATAALLLGLAASPVLARKQHDDIF